MKKRIVTVMLAMVMAFSLAACGSDDSVDPDKYVKLCDLESLEVSWTKYAFTDEDVLEDMDSEFEGYLEDLKSDGTDLWEYTDITDRTDVQIGDLCNIDYEGIRDGEAFEGGTDTGFDLEIGSGSFIEGFEDGLIGHNVGEKVDLNLTFPEDYSVNPDMAGAEVVFHVTINGIRTKSAPEMTDDIISQFGEEFTTVAEFEQYVKDSLQESCDDLASDEKDTNLWAAIMEGSEVSDPPQDMIDQYKEDINANIEMYAQMYGMEKEDFISQGMGYDMETYEAEVTSNATDAAKEELVVRAIAKKAGVKVKDKEVKSRAEAEYADYGYETADEFLKEVGEQEYEFYLLKEKVDEYLEKTVKFVDGEEKNLMDYYNESFGLLDAEDIESEDIDDEDGDLEDASTEDSGEELIDSEEQPDDDAGEDAPEEEISDDTSEEAE